MSYILEALKKLEREKSRSRRAVDPLKQIVTHEYSPSVSLASRASWLKAAVGVLVAVALIGTTYWTTRYVLLPHRQTAVSEHKGEPVVTNEVARDAEGLSGEHIRGRSRVPSSPPSTASDNASMPLDRKRPGSQLHAYGDAPNEDDTGFEGGTYPLKSEYQSRLSPLDAIEQPLDLEDNELGTQGLYSDPASEQEGENTAGERFAVTHAPSGSPALKISAIAWSNDTSKRFAIVNLRSVHEGDSIEGALVHEIHEDGIVFKWQGDNYKILMSRH